MIDQALRSLLAIVLGKIYHLYIYVLRTYQICLSSMIYFNWFSGFWQFACHCAKSSHQLSPDLMWKIIWYVGNANINMIWNKNVPWRCLKPAKGIRGVFQTHQTLAAQMCSCMAGPVVTKKVYGSSTDIIDSLGKKVPKEPLLLLRRQSMVTCVMYQSSVAPPASPQSPKTSLAVPGW